MELPFLMCYVSAAVPSRPVPFAEKPSACLKVVHYAAAFFFILSGLAVGALYLYRLERFLFIPIATGGLTLALWILTCPFPKSKVPLAPLLPPPVSETEQALKEALNVWVADPQRSCTADWQDKVTTTKVVDPTHTEELAADISGTATEKVLPLSIPFSRITTQAKLGDIKALKEILKKLCVSEQGKLTDDGNRLIATDNTRLVCEQEEPIANLLMELREILKPIAAEIPS